MATKNNEAKIRFTAETKDFNAALKQVSSNTTELKSEMKLIEAQMRSAEGVTEKLKRQNPMEWVCHCNNIRNRAAEIIKQELIYV